MKHSKPFRTSELTAVMRALHQTADDEPKILADAIAPRLVNTAPENDDWLQQFLDQPFAKTLGSGFLVRDRYAEHCLAEGVERGVQRYLFKRDAERPCRLSAGARVGAEVVESAPAVGNVQPKSAHEAHTRFQIAASGRHPAKRRHPV